MSSNQRAVCPTSCGTGGQFGLRVLVLWISVAASMAWAQERPVAMPDMGHSEPERSAPDTPTPVISPPPVPTISDVMTGQTDRDHHASLAMSPVTEEDAERLISLNFQDIDIKTLLQVFADFTGLNLVATDAVSGQVTVRLTQLPWRQALQIVLQSKGLASRQEGRVLWVAPQDEWVSREKKQREAQAALDAVSPVQTMSASLWGYVLAPAWPCRFN